ncbi:uncharacterized protein LOC143888916 [Tasmannia lanceolata]|uniref:uncharacterized protein LOC143888916 n=1 Tax=Tasmannia lanceolata TaxID=3420 RepID=UPI0040644A0F
MVRVLEIPGRHVSLVGGVVLRDHEGLVIWAFAGPIGIANADEAEVRAVHQGIKLLVGGRWNNIVVEGDSDSVVRWLSKPLGWPWGFDHLFNEIRDLVGAMEISFRHVKRSANEVADRLARVWVSLEELEIYDELPP